MAGIRLKRLRDGRWMLVIPFGEKTLRFRQGNYSCRQWKPFIERGPFGSWMASWNWGQLEWSLSRWN